MHGNNNIDYLIDYSVTVSERESTVSELMHVCSKEFLSLTYGRVITHFLHSR